MLKAGFRKCHRRPQRRLPLGCEPREQFQLTASYDVSGIHSEYMTHQVLDAVHTRACTGIKKRPYLRNRPKSDTCLYEIFDHKDLGNHLQLCRKVVKHPVYITKMIHGPYNVKWNIIVVMRLFFDPRLNHAESFSCRFTGNAVCHFYNNHSVIAFREIIGIYRANRWKHIKALNG